MGLEKIPVIPPTAAPAWVIGLLTVLAVQGRKWRWGIVFCLFFLSPDIFIFQNTDEASGFCFHFYFLGKLNSQSNSRRQKWRSSHRQIVIGFLTGADSKKLRWKQNSWHLTLNRRKGNGFWCQKPDVPGLRQACVTVAQMIGSVWLFALRSAASVLAN